MKEMIDLAHRYSLSNRYVFKGLLKMQTALHIGGGRVTLSNSDSPVVLTPEDIPFIPGSSFKGALRSTIEKLVPVLPEKAGFFTCGLVELDDKSLAEIEQKLQNDPSLKVCSTQRQRTFVRERRDHPEYADDILQAALLTRCHTCQLFGSPYAASRINVNDLYVEQWDEVIQLRDGVAIDRDSETAKPGLKYDFEVVPATTSFKLEITLENATEQDLQLLSIGLSEFVNGFGMIGGKRSRGLGACKLEDLKVFALELEGPGISDTTRNNRLRDYLLHRTFPQDFTGEAFFDKHISPLFTQE